MEFDGCKLAALYQGKILTYLRDDIPNILFPNQFDLPGGGREGNETAEQCVLRELHEEFGLMLPANRLTNKIKYQLNSGKNAYFFMAILTSVEIQTIVFGEEGQFWQLIPISEFVQMNGVITRLKELVIVNIENNRKLK
ncbi:NUDIX domain-containing protein [Pseudoalteromonas sp.]|uniref:NUDIX domain-containing protein n=1 Tax=Pseudoalteromonas sp. TaxID=53249 RepID=UPI003565CF0D